MNALATIAAIVGAEPIAPDETKAERKARLDRAGAACGPIYPQWNQLAKWRKIANDAGGIRFMSEADRDGYSRAISAAARAAQPRGTGPDPERIKPRCASGTWLNGEALRQAIRKQHIDALHAGAKRDRDRRLAECDWQAEYAAAMIAKAAERARLADLERAAANLEKITVRFIAAPAPASTIPELAPASTSTPQIIAPPLDLPAPANDRAPRQRKPRAAKSAPPAISEAAAFRARHAARLEALRAPRRRA